MVTTEKNFTEEMGKAAIRGAQFIEKEHIRRTNAVPDQGKIIEDWNSFALKLKQNANSEDKNIFSSDFSNYNKASDDIYANSPMGGSLNENGSLSLEDLMYFGNFRVGVTHRATYGMANDAMRNWFQFADADSLKPKSGGKYKEIYKKMVSSNFRNTTPYWGGLARNYGCGFLVKFWGNNDQMDLKPPKTIPRRFEAISPIFMQPTNTWQSRGITYDDEIWEFTSGRFGGANANTFNIHKDRVEVFRPQPRPDMWRGLSVLDPISLAINCYLNIFIFITRAFAKFGNMVPVWKAATSIPTKKEVEGRLDMMEAFKMSGHIVIGKDDSVEFPNTRIGAGLYEVMQIYKEDIASGLSAPMNQLFGLSESGGIGSGGALSAERTYMNTLANFEMSASDNIINCWKPYFPELEDDTLLWNLALQKTKVQQMQEESLRIQNEIAEESLKMARQQAKMGALQIKLFEENKDAFTTEEQIETSETIKDDFLTRQMKVERYKQLQALLRPTEKN